MTFYLGYSNLDHTRKIWAKLDTHIHGLVTFVDISFQGTRSAYALAV